MTDILWAENARPQSAERPIEASRLPLRTRNALANACIYFVDELATMPRYRLLSIRGIGKASLSAIERCLRQAGLGAAVDKEPDVTPNDGNWRARQSREVIHMNRNRATGCRELIAAAVFGIAVLTGSTSCQTGATVVFPKAGEIRYAGYEGDTLASWDSVTVEWTYDDTATRITKLVMELSPNNGRTWATMRMANRVKLGPASYLSRIDTAGTNQFSPANPAIGFISDSCRIRVYDYDARSFGGVSGTFAVRRGPPPAGVVRGGAVNGGLMGPADHGGVTVLSIIGPAQPAASVFTVNGRVAVVPSASGFGAQRFRAPRRVRVLSGQTAGRS